MQIRIGTRGSNLALWQAKEVAAKLLEKGYESEIVIINTVGDTRLDVPLHQLGEQGVFTKALDEALINNQIDIAVHSTKDIPGVISEQIELMAVLEREDPRDVLVALNEEIHLENFSRNFKIGTSSVRRKAWLNHHFPQHEILDIRGNLDTRFTKLKNGEFDALLLAYAGVKRAGYSQYIVQKISPFNLIPAVGQGAVGIVSMKNATNVIEILKTINHESSFQTILAERAFLKVVNGGCKVPVYAYAINFQGEITIEGGVTSLDGQTSINDKIKGTAENAEEIGKILANSILSRGGSKIIHEFKN